MLRFAPRRLVAALRHLPPHRMAAFATLCARRLAAACAAHGEVDRSLVSALRQLHDRLWLDLTGASMGGGELDTALERAMALLPADEASAPLASDTVATLGYAVRARRSGDPQEAVWAAQRAYDYQDALAQAALPAEADEAALLAYPAVQAELRRQAADLADLHALGATDDDVARLDALGRRADASM